MISVSSTLGQCKEFFDGNREEEVSVVVTPLRVFVFDEGKAYRIHWGCSKHYHCHNEACEFSFKERRQTWLSTPANRK